MIGEALIFDVSHVGPNEEITAETLEKSIQGLPMRDFVIIKTTWDKKCSWETYEYWDNAPYISEEGAKYLKSLDIKVIGYDFPQDYDIRKLRFVSERETYQPTHEHLLKNGVLMIEYLCNLDKINTNIVKIAALPLNLQNADGAQIRVVAILD
ncbi:MAG: cyclase family protein [Tepidanaerobacteraceae bacterium]